MDYGYIVNEGEGRLRLYTRKGNAIRCTFFDDDRTVKTETISESSEGSFFVGETESESFIVFRQFNGELVLESGVENRIIGKDVREDIHLNVLMSERKMRLIYMKGNFARTLVRGEGESCSPEEMGEVTEAYRLIPLVKEGWALLYKKRTPETRLCYREVTVNAIGEERGLYTTGFDIGDSSLCAGDNALHFAFVSMSRFAVRVMYVRREDNTFTRPKTLWEGSRCTAISIACDGSDVFVWWEASGHVFESVSHNFGDNFCQCTRKNNVRIMGKALHLYKGCYGVSEVMLTDRGIYAPKEVKELIYGKEPLKKEVETEKKTESGTDIEERLKAELLKSRENTERLSDMLKNRGEEAIKREQQLRKRIRELESRLAQENSANRKEEEVRD